MSNHNSSKGRKPSLSRRSTNKTEDILDISGPSSRVSTAVNLQASGGALPVRTMSLYTQSSSSLSLIGSSVRRPNRIPQPPTSRNPQLLESRNPLPSESRNSKASGSKSVRSGTKRKHECPHCHDLFASSWSVPKHVMVRCINGHMSRIRRHLSPFFSVSAMAHLTFYNTLIQLLMLSVRVQRERTIATGGCIVRAALLASKIPKSCCSTSAQSIVHAHIADRNLFILAGM